MALCKTLMFLQGVLLSDSSHAFCQQLSLYKKNRPKAICNATAPKTLPQHIPRKLQLKTLLAEVVRYTPLPQHIPRKLQHLTPEEFYAQYEDLCLSTSRANCNRLPWRFGPLTGSLPQHIPRKLQRRKTQMFFHLIVL